MTYYKDLSDYRYVKDITGREDAEVEWLHEDNSSYQLLNVGWLDGRFPFPSGSFHGKEKTLKIIANYCRYSFHITMGMHICNICEDPYLGLLRLDQPSFYCFIGDGEIYIKGDKNIIYVAPTLIYHYIEKHRYIPPKSFIEALLSKKHHYQYFSTKLKEYYEIKWNIDRNREEYSLARKKSLFQNILYRLKI
jgi:hypothetical protein